jgi:hypothetical protein
MTTETVNIKKYVVTYCLRKVMLQAGIQIQYAMRKRGQSGAVIGNILHYQKRYNLWDISEGSFVRNEFHLHFEVTHARTKITYH